MRKYKFALLYVLFCLFSVVCGYGANDTRLYNPNADCGSHHYTGSKEEMDYLVSLGWIYEGIGWYGMLK